MKPLCLLLSLVLVGCAVGPDFVPPAAPPVTGYVAGGDPGRTSPGEGQAQRFVPGAPVQVEWWHMFASADLDRAIDDALSANPTLQVAEATLRAADAEVRAGAGIFYPQVALQAGASRQTSTPARIGVNAPSSVFNLFTAGATVSYALDIFGGNRRAVESLAAQAEAQRQAVGTAWLALTGTYVNTAIARAGYTAQIDATEALLRLVREQVDITRAQVDAGTATYASELALESQLAGFEATLPPLKQHQDQAEHLLATLAGRYPAQAGLVELSLESLTLPGELPSLLPAELVRRRPDILAAQARLHAASAEVGVATAAMLPNIVLSAGYGREGTNTADLFRAGGAVWSVAGSLAAPVFEGGTLYSRHQAAVARWEAAQADYRQVVLTAFGQVADVLRALEHDAALVDAQDRSRRSAQRLVDAVQANYTAGTAGYLQVLVANTQYQQATIGYWQARTQRLQDTVLLFVALGGGWWKDD